MLKQNVYLIAVLTTVSLAVGTQSPVQAAERLPIVELSPGYVHEDGRLDLEFHWNPTVDVPMFAVGFVQAFLGPLSHLDASDSEVEYTWITTDQLSDGATFGSGTCHLYSIDAKGGRLTILRDTTPDANLSDPLTFADGEIVLEAYFRDFQSFSLLSYDCPWGEELTVWFFLVFNEGSHFSDLSPELAELPAEAVGTYQWDPPASVLDLDYFTQFQVTISIDDSVPVRPTTWGRIKALYW